MLGTVYNVDKGYFCSIFSKTGVYRVKYKNGNLSKINQNSKFNNLV